MPVEPEKPVEQEKLVEPEKPVAPEASTMTNPQAVAAASTIEIPDFCLVLLLGPSGAGKSTFAQQHFLPTEILSSDVYRGVVSDDSTDQQATADAFDVLEYILRKRLAARRLTVVDATNVRKEDRASLLKIARQYHALTVAFVLNMPESVCHARNALRADREFGEHVVRNQSSALRRSLKGLRREGVRYRFEFKHPDEVAAVCIERTPIWSDQRQESGPFDIIGDVHGCFDELHALLIQLGYEIAVTVAAETNEKQFVCTPPAGRRAVFVGDLVDRGPNAPDCLRLVMDMVDAGVALCVPGNHEVKLSRKLAGRNVKLTHGLAETVAQLTNESDVFLARCREFIDGLVSHVWLDDGRLVVAHAGLEESMHGRSSGAVRSFALYGETTGETDEFGFPVRYHWAKDYRGDAMVVYGHTPVPEAEWLNNTICIDTGCVFGGQLTALRYPETELVAVPAQEVYYEPSKPLRLESGDDQAAQHAHDDLLHMDDVAGKRMLNTPLYGRVTVRKEQSAAALEILSRFAVHPKWLVYLPPTMSPSETSQRPGYLEHPEDALAYYQRQGVTQVVCEQKHMGSRAIVVLCKDATVAKQRFGVESACAGVVYTRTGRNFFTDSALESAFLQRMREACDASGFWDELATDWVVFDSEIMPWSAKAQSLLESQYAPVGAAANAGLQAANDLLAICQNPALDVADLQAHYAQRLEQVQRYQQAYRHYCWPVQSIDDYQVAPFHVLATEGQTYFDRDHHWHMQTIAKVAAADAGFVLATTYHTVDVTDAEACAKVIDWWQHITDAGQEGMVVKPLGFTERGERGLLQPALKCRGQEYLRIIYGPEYLLPEQLARLRQRGLNRKRSLALREYALGVTGLERFAQRQPLRRVHECVSAVLALESDPVDPRL